MQVDPNAQLLFDTIHQHEQTILSLRRDNEALKAEFSKAGTYEEQLKIAKKAIADLLELSITTTRHLISNADSESVRANLSKFVITTVLDGKLDSDTENSIRSLIDKLANNDTEYETQAQKLIEPLV